MSLTCISCKLLFSVPELHQEHYKSDWHRYNLKRRLAELPSLTKEEFDKRAAQFREDAEGKLQNVSLLCKSCNKRFSSKNAMVNHLKSKKHLEIEAGDRSNPVLATELFLPALGLEVTKAYSALKADGARDCSNAAIAKQMLTPASRMKKTKETDLEMEDDDDDEGWSDEDDDGWETDDETGEKLVIDTHDCLFCDHQSDSTEGNVSHMTVEHSFFIPDIEVVTDIDGLIAVLAAKIHVDHFCLWCNGKGKGFRSVKSVKQHMIDKGHCKMLHEGEAVLDYADYYDYAKLEESSDSGDTSVIEELLEDSDYELVLPSGATIGHRSLALYYKQNLKPVSSDSRQKVKKVLQHYKSLGYSGAMGPAAVKTARDISYMQKMRSRYQLKLGVKQNRFQPHFRSQVMF